MNCSHLFVFLLYQNLRIAALQGPVTFGWEHTGIFPKTSSESICIKLLSINVLIHTCSVLVIYFFFKHYLIYFSNILCNTTVDFKTPTEKRLIERDHSSSLGLMIVDCQKFAGSRIRYFLVTGLLHFTIQGNALLC